MPKVYTVPVGKRSYYYRWMSLTLKKTWVISHTPAGLMAYLIPLALIPFVAWYFPTWAPSMLDLAWQIPVAVWVTTLVVMGFLAPSWLDEEREREREGLIASHQHTKAILRQKIAALEQQLHDRRAQRKQKEAGRLRS